MDLKIKTAFLDEHNKAVLICPKCRKSKSVDLSERLKDNKQIRLTYRFKCDHCDCGTSDCTDCKIQDCSHGYSNTVRLERRIYERKKVRLHGMVTTDDRRKEKVTISDLSRTGIQFELKSAYSFEPGDRAVIEFALDDAKKTSIKKEIVIRKADSPLFGAVFSTVDPEDPYDQAIAHYLFGLAIPRWQM